MKMGLFMWKEHKSLHWESAITSLRNFIASYGVKSVKMVGDFVVFEGHTSDQIGVLIFNAKDLE